MLCPEPSLWNSIAGLVNHLNWSLGKAVPAQFMVSLSTPIFEQCILTSYWNKEAVFVNKMTICTILGSFATNKAFPFSIEKGPFAWEEISSGSISTAVNQREI